MEGKPEGDTHAGVSTDQRYMERGSFYSADGRSLAWEVQTEDGLVGEVQIS